MRNGEYDGYGQYMYGTPSQTPQGEQSIGETQRLTPEQTQNNRFFRQMQFQSQTPNQQNAVQTYANRAQANTQANCSQPNNTQANCPQPNNTQVNCPQSNNTQVN
ncbi:MAG: hypothetical protein LBM60_00580, partial [Clostridium sp.]|nr:hypothetical protein [Clostridium sp.]